SLELTAPARPLLLDEAGRAAASYLDNGTWRVCYLSFDLQRVGSYAAQPLVETCLELLRATVVETPALRLTPVQAGPLSLGLDQDLEVRGLVTNEGRRSSGPFRVGYRVLQGEQVLAAADRVEAPLAVGEVREVELPSWQAPSEGEYRLRLGLGSTVTDSLTFLPDQELSVLEVGAVFAEVPLPTTSSLGNGAGLFDYDGDNDLDLYLVRLGLANQLWRNDGTGFTEQAEPAGVAVVERGRGLAIGDSDGDGDLDLYLVNEGLSRFLRNQGDGTFVEATAQLTPGATADASLDHRGSGRSAGFFDLDRDGDLDLFVVNALGTNRLYCSDDGRFTEQAARYGLADPGDGRGLAIGDWDGDGDPDLFVANTDGTSHLFRNEVMATGRFVEATQELGLAFTGGEVAALFGDYDNDGDPDLFLSNERGAGRLWRNEAGAAFVPVHPAGGAVLGARTVGAAWVDYDNDGDLDLAVTGIDAQAGGDQLYQNRGGGQFLSVGARVGLQTASIGRAVVGADYDQDGRQDLVVADYEGSRLYRNLTAPDHWLQLDLGGAGGNLNGLGAQVTLTVQGERQYREVQSGFGYGSQMQPRVSFGLGEATRVDSVQVTWPDGARRSWLNLGVDQRLLLAYPNPSTAVTADGPALPTDLMLAQNLPNPFNAATVLPYHLPRHTRVEVVVFDVTGQRVRTLVDQVQPSGEYRLLWDGRDEDGRAAASGVYLCRLTAGADRRTRRLVLLR
ncbi:MAG: FG-GAP-like repeat-containing protein, partial [Candidatus Latescibacterota bacterium]